VQVIANKGESGDADPFWHTPFRAFAKAIARNRKVIAPRRARRVEPIKRIFARSSSMGDAIDRMRFSTHQGMFYT